MRRIIISFFLSILLLEHASSDNSESECLTKETLESGETCDQLGASADHYCVENTDGAKPCNEEDACNLLYPDIFITDKDRCSERPKHNKDNHCKEITVGSIKKCKEVPVCEGATPDTINYENCKDLWINDSNKKCIVNEDNDACTVAAECADVKNGADADLCGLFTTEASKCVVADEGNGCKVAAECADVIKGANADVCGLFTTETSKCVVANDGEGCKVAENCADVIKGANSNVCSLFTTETSKCVVGDNGDECIPKNISGKKLIKKEQQNVKIL